MGEFYRALRPDDNPSYNGIWDDYNSQLNYIYQFLPAQGKMGCRPKDHIW